MMKQKGETINLINRLNLLTGSFQAGNTSQDLIDELRDIIHELSKKKLISKDLVIAFKKKLNGFRRKRM